MGEEQAVMLTLEEYAATYCAKDIDGLMAVFDDGEDISMIGTGADELCSGRSQVRSVFERNFAEATATKFEWHWKHVIVTGSCAVVAVKLTIHLTIEDQKITVPIRWTVSLIKRGDNWKWLHRHASAAAGSQEEGTAYPEGESK